MERDTIDMLVAQEESTQENKHRKVSIPKIEIAEKGRSERIINNVMWGDSKNNPNKRHD